MGDIVWLASYPKSGNTWLRALLANLLDGKGAPININRLGIRIAADRRGFDEALGVEASDMTREEIARARPAFYRTLASHSAGSVYLKIHDAFRDSAMISVPLSASVRSRVVYLARNPLDVAVSFANHIGRTIDDTIGLMADPEYSFSGRKDRLPEQLEQRISSWSEHVVSWLDQREIPVHLMRYEDMLSRQTEAFARCLEFLDICAGASEIESALAASSFTALSAQEAAFGFRERPPVAARFFRRGRAGDWRTTLTDAQVHRIVEQHVVVMRRLGYTNGDSPAGAD
jgi:hypothetical protein